MRIPSAVVVGAIVSPVLLASPSRAFSSPSLATTSRPAARPSQLCLSNAVADFLSPFKSLLPEQQSNSLPVVKPNNNRDNNVAVQFFEYLNDNNLDAALELISDSEEVEWDECTFYQTCIGKQAVERRLRLQSETTSFRERSICVDNVAVDGTRNTIGVLFHRNDKKTGTTIPNSRGCAMFQLLEGQQQQPKKIQRVVLVTEPTVRGGETGLNILSQASKVMDVTGYNPEAIEQESRRKTRQPTTKSTTKAPLSPPEQYFDAWNRRDMTAAVQVFADDNIKYEDTAFPEPFVGKQKLKEHLIKCSNAFPASFQIVIDTVAIDTNSCSGMAEWHFENGEGEALPFTQGCSFYKLDNKAQKIVEGIDFIEPAVVKPSGLSMFTDSLATKLSQEPVRWIPVLSWVAYMYIVFLSDGILPGANALQLEARTWEEVLNLSLNFFLVSPLLHLPFSPSVHPMLEGVFNLLLSWAAMFAGFLSDERPRKPNLLPMFPIVVGMQFLTSAFLLPYLAVRSSETTTSISDAAAVTKEELPVVAQVAGESPVLGALMGLVGSGSILWFFLGRAEEYGADFAVRYASFLDLLSIDRVGSSFLVDLAIFAAFQGWLVDDDLKRRGVSDGELALLERVAKYVPFFGLAAYLVLRPSLPEETGNRYQ
ncbi:expressed unknown protein [Seminavis robusta]|uniref:SnoaL-like domain-containing protein n=1 Tax=Seminavis robusta TaxID=568900 RepID=A0A9N8DPB1_9STRA|nr:expressed unknown protein [Seminavis robusta]|eukprot:Sro250_g099080.1 n/a (652) ;mRNA; r:74942-76897